MMEKLEVAGGDKIQIYETLIPQIKSLTEGESDLCANMANIAAALKETFGFFWVGFYLVKADDSQYGKTLVLGPFQGPVACTRISFGKGVCGTAWKDARSLVVPDVDLFPGHIACSSLSRSEIVIPVVKDGEVVAVLDIDSKDLSAFDKTDDLYLTKLIKFIY
ncbi:MAG: GAF domain-containing protein [Rikenellaceae bacterium]